MEGFIDSPGGRRERIRERIANGGLDRMRPHEVLEFLLYYIIPRQDVNRLSRDLLDYFGTLGDVLAAEIPELMKVEGVGRKTAEWIALAGECCYECARLKPKERIKLQNYTQAFIYACRIYSTVTPPCSIQICLDVAGGICYRRTICESRAWGEPDTLREALADVIASNCSSVMIIQCMGNMHAEPDEYDITHAREYAHTLGCAGSGLMDVVLVGDGGVASMRQMGFVPEKKNAGNVHRMMRERYMENMPESGRMDAAEISMLEEKDEFLDV